MCSIYLEGNGENVKDKYRLKKIKKNLKKCYNISHASYDKIGEDENILDNKSCHDLYCFTI
jgi:hypothetical protein